MPSEEHPVRVKHGRDIPESDGVIPWWNADETPPETVLQRYSRCPHCHETMPTIGDIYRAWVNKQRLAQHRLQVHTGSEMYTAYTEGIKHYRDEIEAMTYGLDNAARKWIRELFQEHYNPSEGPVSL